jgi:hypothetical protein
MWGRMTALAAGGVLALAAGLAPARAAGVEGVLVGNGDKITSAIESTLDTDAFTIGVGEGGKLGVTVGATKGSTLLPAIRLFDPDGDEVSVAAILVGAGGKKVSFKNFVIPVGGTGTWRVLVSGAGTSGGYTASFKATDPKSILRKGVVIAAGTDLEFQFPAAAGATITGKVKLLSGTLPETALFREDANAGGGAVLVLPAFAGARALPADAPVESRLRSQSSVILGKDGGAGDCTVDLKIKIKVPKVLKRKAFLPQEAAIGGAAPLVVRQGASPTLDLDGVFLQGDPSPRIYASLPGSDDEDTSLAVTASAYSGTPVVDPLSGATLSPAATLDLDVAADAPWGARGLVYIPPALLGEPVVLDDAFDVEAPVPTVTAVSPTSVRQEDAAVVLTVTGTGFRDGGALSFSGTGITPGTTTVVSDVEATVTVAVASGATVGARNVTFAQPAAGGGSSGTGTGLVTVKNPVPTVTSASPSILKQGDTSVTVTATGTGFRSGGALSISGTGITVGSATVVNATTATASFTVASNATTGLRSLTWTQPAGGGGDAGTGVDVITVNFPDPTVTSIAPTALRQLDSSATLTLTGTGFRTGGAITISGTGLTLGSTTVTNDTTASVPVTVDVAATVGTRDVTFTQAAGGGGAAGTKSAALTIKNPVPTLTTVSPGTVTQGDTGTTLTLTGTNFRSGGTVSAGTGISVTGTNFVSTTSFEATVDVAAGATLGLHDVVYTQPAAGGGDSVTKSNALQVDAPDPTVTAIDTAVIKQGDVNVARFLTGTNFRSGGTLTISGSNVTASSVVVTSATRVDFNLSATAAAATGNRDVTWTQPASGGGAAATLTNGITVNFPDPTVTSISPTSLRQLDSSATFTLTGTGFRTGGAITISGTGLTLGSTTVTNDTTASVPVTVDVAATVGTRDVTFTQAAGGGGAAGTKTGALTIKNPLPTLTTVAPGTVTQGDTGTTLTLTGTNFRSGGTVSAGTGISVTGTNFVSTTTFEAVVDTAIGATLGPHDVVYTQPAGGGGDSVTKTNALQVNAPNPTVTAIDTAVIKQGDTNVARFITGTNFRSGGTLTISGANVTASSVVVTSATRVDFNLSATSGAAVGNRDVTWTQPASGGGAAGTLTNGITVNFPNPTLTSASPATIDREASGLTLTLTGTNFRSGGTVSVSGTGVTLSSPAFVNETTFTVTYSVDAAATLGFRDLTYTHTGGGGASATKTSAVEVLPVGVNLASLSPSAWLPGTPRFRCVATGANFNSGTTTSVSGSGVTVHSTTFNSSTTLTLEISVDSAAALGARDVTITPGAGGGSAKTFNGAATVAASAPVVSTFSAATLAQGASSTAVTIRGSGFRSGDVPTASGTGVSFASVTVVDSGTITASATVTGGAATGARNLTVTHGSSDGGLSGTLASAFTVVGATPTVSAVNPAQVGRTGSGGATRQVPITITGTNFMTGATLAVSKTSASGLSVVSSSEAVVSDTRMTATLSITGTATTGTWNLVVTNPQSLGNSGSSGNNLLDVKDENTLCVHRVDASSGTAFGGEKVTVYGSGFAAGATVDFGTVTAAGSYVVDKGTIVTTVPIPSGQSSSTVRVVDVKVTASGGGSSATLTGGYTYAKDDGFFRATTTFPVHGATSVPRNLVSAVVRLTYPADTTTGTYGTTFGTNVTWFENGGTFTANGLRGFGPGGKTLVFSRTGGGNLAIASAGQYILSLPVTLKSLGGVALTPVNVLSLAQDQYSFTLHGSNTDATAPTLSSIVPSNTATGVDLTSGVKITFSEEIDPLTVTAANITFKQGSTVIPATYALSDDLKSVTITPHATLAASTVYTTNATANVKDCFGNAFSNTSWTFTTGSGTDGTAPVFDRAILEELPADVDGTGTFVNSGGTGGNAFDVFLPQSGWLVDVRFSDSGGSGIKTSTFTAVANVAVAGNSAGTNLASNFTVTPTGATWRIPSTGFATGDDATFTFGVQDIALNTATNLVITFDVFNKDSAATSGGDHDPFDSRHSWVIRADIDAYTATYSTATSPNRQGATTSVASNGIPDLDESLRVVGLNTASMTTDAANTVNGTETGTNAILKRLFLVRLRELLNLRYGITEDGVHGTDSPDVEFLLPGEQGSLGSMPSYSTSTSSASAKSFSEISIGGTKGADASAFAASGTLGQAFIDQRNLFHQADCNFASGTDPTGIYLLGMMKLNVNGSLTASVFGSRISAKLVTIHGGTPAGEGSLDDDVLAGTFDRTSGGNSAAQNTRYDQIMDAVELVALYSSAVMAHEVGHSTGLASDGAPKTGLFGAAHFNNTFTEATSTSQNTSFHLDFTGNDLMGPTASFTLTIVTGTDFAVFNPLDRGYMRGRVIYDEDK